MSPTPTLTASWIWHRQDSYIPYHQVILARRRFRLAQTPLRECEAQTPLAPTPSGAPRVSGTPGARECEAQAPLRECEAQAPLRECEAQAPLRECEAQAVSGQIKIAVDGGYRLFVNDQWVADGPARSWPEHFQYDVIDAGPYLRSGSNELKVIARHWQVGDFHTRPQQAGLLVQLDLQLPGGGTRRIVSDGNWQTAWLPAWSAQTPKVSIQMEPQELYDARRAPATEDDLAFALAAVLYPAQGTAVPWQDLHPRDVALLARRPKHPQRFLGASLVKHQTDLNFCLPAVRLAAGSLPGGQPAAEANHFASAAGGMATVLELDAPAHLRLALEGMLAGIDGKVNADGSYDLPAGRHNLLAFAWPMFGHRKERNLRIVAPPEGLKLVNPRQADFPNPWLYLALPQFALREDDMDWTWFEGPEGGREAAAQAYRQAVDDGLAQPFDPQDPSVFSAMLLPAAEMFVTDTHWQFTQRQTLGSAAAQVEQPGSMMHDNPQLTTLYPSAEGDLELAYDLGEQSVGYFEFELTAPAGVQLDLYAVEYVKPDGTIQHTGDNHNGLRYVTRAGRNHFVSLKRRAGRYLFLTLRNLTDGSAKRVTAPVQVRLLRVIEATYPVEQRAGFECSDASLGRIWHISARTLELCMEDTFTDCPLYEQTYWVGDARNESLFAYDAFGATDIARRCLRLAAQSLERYPLVGGQVPSSWDMLLPAWSFLWGVAVWDHYFYTGDRAALEELWPAVVRNLVGAAGLLDEHGLFSGKFWNMFDWTPVDDHHPTVLHNSLLLVGAIQAAEKMAGVLADAQRADWLGDLRTRLAAAINRWWDPERQAYPDSIHADGQPSPSTCMHTSFLALLYDVLPSQWYPAALRNTLTPPPEMVRVGSPFAIQYLYEALDKAGRPDEILRSIYANYLPMLAEDATTVWEVFPTSGDHPGGFPTRSHCHAWSAAPLHFLPQVVLGIRQAEPGGGAYTVSPWIGALNWARGSVCTARGLLEVSWEIQGKGLAIHVRAPQGTAVRFETNPSLAGLEVQIQVSRSAHIQPRN